ncbi:MAG: Gfo/Idh/MocA family oxidoreductase [Candidatus Nealsonbacteria bacterium]|nr:Gfo/Idh/MocA family oxidoreductase [Candidatus Nealsonbacteria bacterium]
MRQLVQNLRSGNLTVENVPAPLLRDQGILVQTRASLVSAGTERMMLELAKKSLIGKAKERPDLVRKVLDKLRRDGFLATFKTVRDKLDSDVPMGYSACGKVTEVGARAREFEVGQYVACAGAGYANHAEVNYVPRLLAVPVPEGVTPEAAAYSTVGTIALQGVRNADVRVGETVVVLGLGLIGQLTVQLLKASGCRVVGLDLAKARVELAAENGADLALVLDGDRTDKAVIGFTRGRGADAILITAATASNAPVEQAAELARDRARVVMVGVTGMHIPRTPYFKKELTFIVSRSYGPGRYDPQYEEHGHDYPAGYVRWTENRNIEAFLDLVAAGSVRPEVCTTHRFPVGDAEDAFDLILTNSQPHLGVVLTYPEESAENVAGQSQRISLVSSNGKKPTDKVGVSVVGAGGFARSVHLPTLAKLPNVSLRGIVDASGIAASSAGKKFGFAYCASDDGQVFDDNQTDAVILMTPHSQHADGICRALKAGKAVFVEKPLAINLEQVDQIRKTLESHPNRLMVGFNRRFSPLAKQLKEFIGGRGPLTVSYRCNAGPLPTDHWISDPAEGGRIIGEACHFFDFFAYLTDATPQTVSAAAPSTGSPDDAVVTVTYDDGSVCQLTYTTVGPASFSKERIEAFAGGCVGVLEDFRRLELHGGGKRARRRKTLQADKGHAAELEAFLDAVQEGQESPIQITSLLATTLTSLAALESMRCQRSVDLPELGGQ